MIKKYACRIVLKIVQVKTFFEEKVVLNTIIKKFENELTKPQNTIWVK
jgi:hypothetical protein